MFKKVYIEITNICNLNCKFCPDTKRKKKFMEVEEFEHIIKEVYKYTNLICLHVKGEPLLHPNLDKILEILEKYNLRTNITTNGVLLREKVHILKKSKALRQLNISVHSLKQNENFNNRYLKGIFEVSDELSNVIISYRLWNLDSFKENNINNSIIDELEKHYNMINLKQELIKNSYVKLKDNIFINQDLQFVWPSIAGKEIVKSGRCLALKEQIAILVDGTVVPCCLDNDGDITLGNIFNENLKSILNSSKSAIIKKNFENGIITCKLCKSCGFLERLENKRKKK